MQRFDLFGLLQALELFDRWVGAVKALKIPEQNNVTLNRQWHAFIFSYFECFSVTSICTNVHFVKFFRVYNIVSSYSIVEMCSYYFLKKTRWSVIKNSLII